MKLLFLAITLGILTVGSGFLWLEKRQSDLRTFCSSLPMGQPLAEVRKLAQKQGFKPVLEPFAQLRIIPPGPWHDLPPACRVFFNRDRTLEYRFFERS